MGLSGLFLSQQIDVSFSAIVPIRLRDFLLYLLVSVYLAWTALY